MTKSVKPQAQPTQPYSILEVIDADMARELLKHNKFHEVGVAGTNRPIRPALVDEYARNMLAGEWIVTDQGIGVDVNDMLINGQHRLLALIKAAETQPDITIESWVIWNLPVGSKLATDIGGGRRPKDFLAMEGIGNGNNVGAALKLLHDYQTWRRFRASPKLLMSLVEQYPQVEDAHTQGRGAMAITSPASITAALTIVMRDRRDLDVERYLLPLRTGANIGIGSPILALRNWTLNATKTKKQVNGVILLGLIMRSLNHWIEDTRAQYLVFRPEDAFPTLTTKEFYPR